jgi:chaperonin cofactor prefoldin
MRTNDKQRIEGRIAALKREMEELQRKIRRLRRDIH